MAKQRKAPTRRAVSKSRPKSRKPSAVAVRKKVGQKTKPRPAPPVASRVPPPRSTYAEAIATYERGLAAIQRRQYGLAADTLRSILELYPEEKELHERVKLYLRVCERHLEPVDRTARTPEEQVYAATLAVNEAAYDKAVELATTALGTNPDMGNAEYILAVALTLKGDLSPALRHLARAIELSPENRDLARRDADFDALRRTDEARSLLASPVSSTARRDRARPINARTRGAAK